MLLPFDVGIVYLLDVNKCTHLVSGETHSTFPEILLWSTTNAFYIQSLATVFQNGRHLGLHKERRDWPQYCL